MSKEFSVDFLKEKAKDIRKLIIEVANRSKCAHVGSSFSCTDVMAYLYFYELNIDENNFENRDIFVLSKGHAGLTLYATLTARGYITEETFFGYNQNNGTLPVHLDRLTNKWIEASAGSLGHGFNIALGMAHGIKLKKQSHRRIFTLIGDGETEEGSIWEGAMFGSSYKLDNLTAFIDYNNLQGYGRPTEICTFEPIVDKWEAFGWDTYLIDGHDFTAIKKAVDADSNGKPKMIITKTIKGKGVSFMEDEMKWHYFIVTDEFKEQSLAELEGAS